MDSATRPRWAVDTLAVPFEKLATGLSSTQTPAHAPTLTPTPTPKPTPTPSTDVFNILQVNVCGLQPRSTELTKMLSDNNIHIALIQETILPRHRNITVSGYTKYPCQCQNSCQGIMTLVRNDTEAKVTNLETSSDVDIQKIITWDQNKKKKLTLFNTYWPPGSKNDLPFQESSYTRTIIAGDLNAHSPTWGYSNLDGKGKQVEALCNGSNMVLMQNSQSEATLLHRRTGTMSRPDLTMISADIADNCKVSVLEDIGSDHKPILTSLKYPKKKKQRRKPLWNYRKANWTKYKSLTDNSLAELDMNADLEKMYSGITKAILTAAKKAIPRGNRKRYSPFWNAEVEAAVKDRRKARGEVEKDPTRANKTHYNKMTGQVRQLVKTGKKNHWTETCRKLDLRKEGHKAWGLLHSLAGDKQKKNPEPLQRGDKLIADNRKKANAFNKHFATVNKKMKRNHLDRALKKILKKKEKAARANIKIFEADFTPEELQTEMKKLKMRKSPGPDEISNEMIRNLGTRSQQVLLAFINRTWREGKLPTGWLLAHVKPILKKGKPAEETKSYRPISLTSCFGKLAERMVNTRLYWWLESVGILDNHQAGFRKGSRTDDQLFRFLQDTIDGFQNQRHTTAIFIDLQQAYDRVWRQGLFMKMENIGIHGRMYAWIKAFLQNRAIRTVQNGAISAKRTLEEGLPQGSSLSCTLFLIFINDLPSLLKVSKALYADDLVIWVTEKYDILARAKLKQALATINTYCNFWKMKLNVQKTTYAIFTRSHKVAKQTFNFKVDGIRIQKDNNPSYLGITLDQQLNLNRFISDLKDKATGRLNLLKRLASTTWGANKQTLRQMYIGYVRSVMDYGASLQTIASKSTTSSLDRVQNQASRLICGGFRSTPTAACEIDANLEPMDIRRERATLEATERYRRLPENHPNRRQIDRWRSNQRLQQLSPIQASQNIMEKHHLPENRKPLQKVPDIPPGTSLKNATIKTSLLDPSLNKNSDPLTLKQGTLETVDIYSSTPIHVYTDGSAFKATINAGAGVTIKYPNGTKTRTSLPCGRYCSNYTAEIKAIDKAITILHSNFTEIAPSPDDIVIFTDSLSALQDLENLSQKTNTEITELATKIDALLGDFNIHLTLQWIPGHIGIQGNEAADKLAREGASKEQPDNPLDMQTTKQILRNNSKEEWMNRWATGTTGRSVYKEMSNPKKNDSINQLCRANQSTIFQWRTTHTRVNFHLNRLNPEHAPHCRNCNAPYETVKHILLECTKLQLLRKQYLPPQPSIQNTLYGTCSQMNQTCRFVKLALAEEE